jgi:hypothetical protein
MQSFVVFVCAVYWLTVGAVSAGSLTDVSLFFSVLGLIGSIKVNVVPFPTVLSTLMLPP